MKTAKNRGDASIGPQRVAERIILGIDPGTTAMGFAVISVNGQVAHLLDAGVFRFDRTLDHSLRLRDVFRCTQEVIETHLPDELAIEAQFFGKNVQSMLKLGRAQGVAIAAAIQRELVITEYAPKRVKQSITGNGNATKEQVSAMLLSILKVDRLPESTDATDAIAVAVCHHFAGNGSVPSTRKGRSDWSGFVRNNPERVK